MGNPLGRALTRWYRRAIFSPLRYSKYFLAAQGVFSYWPNEEMLKIAMKFAAVSKLEGDYLEFGVYEGANVVAAWHLARHHGLHGMRLYAFDSFQGLPPVASVDHGGDVAFFERGEFSCDLETFRRNTRRKGVDPERLTIVPGWYGEVLTAETRQRLPLQKAAIVWVDCDLYESTVPVLDFVTDYVQDGTVLVFDDWFCFRGDPDRGEQRAFREWLQRHPSLRATPFHRFGWHGQSFLLHPGNREATNRRGDGRD
ncbi:MAG: class I SAM-dependent methyltransferase [Candidatus Rokubacteria bacterium]|nr:class I SAM-dependent methyltransferase [Candidatus Rokubacteria bacterium]